MPDLPPKQAAVMRLLRDEYPHPVPESMLRDIDVFRPRQVANALEARGLLRFGAYQPGPDDLCGHDLHLTDAGFAFEPPSKESER